MKSRSGRISVLSFQSSASLAGSELMNFSIFRRLDRGRFDVEVCFLDEEGPVTEYYRSEGIPVFHLNFHLRPFPLVLRDFFGIFRRRRFDIIHICGLRANLIGRLVGYLCGCRCIITSQHSVDGWRRFWHVWLDRVSSVFVRLYISNTFAGAERLRRFERISPSKVRVIQNGIDPLPFLGSCRGRIRSRLGVDGGKVVLLCVANFRRAKGHEVLVEVVDRLRRRGVDFHLWLVGDGELRSLIERRVRFLGLSDSVLFFGRRTDIPDILSDSDIFVLSSYWEGMPGAVMEAMASGLPVVATRVGGIPELVRDGETGFLVSPGDPDAFLEPVLRLIMDPGLRYSMGEAGRVRIVKHFSIDEKVRELEEVYESLVWGKG